MCRRWRSRWRLLDGKRWVLPAPASVIVSPFCLPADHRGLFLLCHCQETVRTSLSAATGRVSSLEESLVSARRETVGIVCTSQRDCEPPFVYLQTVAAFTVFVLFPGDCSDVPLSSHGPCVLAGGVAGICSTGNGSNNRHEYGFSCPNPLLPPCWRLIAHIVLSGGGRGWEGDRDYCILSFCVLASRCRCSLFPYGHQVLCQHPY